MLATIVITFLLSLINVFPFATIIFSHVKMLSSFGKKEVRGEYHY